MKREPLSGDDSMGGLEEGEPEEVRSPKRATASVPGVNIWGAKKEDGFQGGRKPLKQRCKAGMVLQEIARAERGRETFPRSP